MKQVKFIRDPRSYNPDNLFVAHLTGMNSEEDLFSELSNKLRFPDYFGFNWDALYDCLRDFSWIDQKGIILVHDQLPGLDSKTFDLYMKILIDCVQDWKEGEVHFLEIVFPEQNESIIRKYLK